MDIYHVDTADGTELGKYEAEGVRDAVRLALDDHGHTVYPGPENDRRLIGRHGQPVHIFCDYLVNGEIVEVRMLDGDQR